MQQLSANDARELLEGIVRDEYSRLGRPLKGASLKPKFTEAVSQKGFTFDETALFSPNFLSFVESCNLAIVKQKAGDFSVAPPEHSAILETSMKRELIRPEFWFGFLSFPKANTIRFYDRKLDRISESASKSDDPDKITLNVVTKEDQLLWRKEFLEKFQNEDPDLQQILPLLDKTSAFHDFSVAIREKPKLRKAWQTCLSQKVKAVVSSWAAENSIAETVWSLPKTEPGTPHTHQEVYAILDKVPIEELLDWAIPLRWALSFRRQK